jgi:O-antigen ligase
MARRPFPVVSYTATICAGAAVSIAFAWLLSARLTIGLGLLVALCYVPIVLRNLPLAIALWAPILFLKYVPKFDAAGHVATVLMALAWLAAIRTGRTVALSVVRRHRRLFGMLALLLVWLALSLAWSVQPSADSLIRWINSGFIILLVATSISTRRDARLLMAGFIVGAVASVAIGLGSEGLTPSAASAASADTTRLVGGTGDPNELAQGLVPAIALAAALLGATRNAVLRLLLACGVAIMIVGLGATESRGGLIAALVAVLCSLVLAKGHRQHVLGFVLLVAGVAAMWFAASPGALHRITGIDSSGSGRSEIWRIAWEVTQDHPIVGVGLDNFKVREPGYARRPGPLRYDKYIIDRPHVVHNLYLQLLAETGVIGLVLFLVVAAGAMRAAWAAGRRFDELGDRAFAGASRAVLVGSIAFLVAAFFLTDGFDSRLWVLLGMGPALLGIAMQRTQAPTFPASR